MNAPLSGKPNQAMKECEHEREVLDLVLAERWPDRCDPDVVAHAADCDVCSDVLAVAMAMREDEARVEAEIIAGSPQHPQVVPDATLVWWRAQMRAQEEAGRRAARPIAMVQGIGIGIGLVAAGSLIRLSWPWLKSYGSGVSGGLSDLIARSTATSTAALETVPLWVMLSVVAAVIAAPIAIYAAIKD